MGRMQQVAMQTGDIARDTMARVFGKRQSQTTAVNRRMLAEHIIRNELTEMALARFKWTGLPDSASEFWIERMLLTRGACLVGRDPRNNAVLALQANAVGPPNYQNEFRAARGIGVGYDSMVYRLLRQPVSVNGEPTMQDPNAVLIYNNATRTPDMTTIQYFAERLAELDTTIDINSMNARRNKVVVAGKDTELAMANIMQEVAEGSPEIRVRDSEMIANITTLDLSVHPDMIDRLHVFRGRVMNDAMTMLGIDNANQDKKERLVTEELGGNDDQIARVRSSMLNQRRLAARKLSDILGIPITVDYFVEDDPSNDPGMATNNMKVEEDGHVHAETA